VVQWSSSDPRWFVGFPLRVGNNARFDQVPLSVGNNARFDQVPLSAATARGLKNYRVGARSAAGSMTALSLTQNVRGHRFQMHHYRGCARDPLSRGFEPLSLLIFLCGGKESKCRPAQGQR
jgi:hypothetical protein